MIRSFETIICQQGSTLRDPSNGQPMHSAIGPVAEAEAIFLTPSRLRERLASPGAPLVLWDVGMGIAGNGLSAWLLAQRSESRRALHIHSFEKHPEALEQALEKPDDFSFLQPHQETLKELLGGRVVQSSESHWQLHVGSFSEILETDSAQIPAPDLIFWDFYSPRVCPDLWSVELFERVRRLAPQSRLYTYSAATPVRVGLLLSGWWVGRPQAEGSTATSMKTESTMAVADASLAPEIPALLGAEWLRKFRSSSQYRPYGSGELSRASFEALEEQVARHAQFDA